MIKLEFNNLKNLNKNFPHTVLYKIICLSLLTFIFGLFFWGGYHFLLSKGQEPIAILTFIGGLIGSFILKIAFDVYNQPILKIETWDNNNDETYKWKCGSHIHYKIRITNNSSFFAKKCQIKITLKFEKKDIVEYSDTGRVMCSEDDSPYIKNEKEYSKIESENILWDVTPHGKQSFEIDIPPKSSFLSTVARYYSNGKSKYFQIKSENEKTPRVYLDPKKDYVCVIQVFGENFYPLTKEAKLPYAK